jgi:hypothetical protein
MSSLEKIKDKLKLKPKVEERKPVEIVIPIAKKQEKVKINVELKNEIDPNYDRDDLKRKLMESKMSKVTIKLPIEPQKQIEKTTFENETKREKAIEEIPIKKAKKMPTKKLLVIEESDEMPTVVPAEKPQEELEELEELPLVKKTKYSRKAKEPRGVVYLEPEDWVEFGDTKIFKRLEEKQPPINMKVSSYYMNNREIFVNFINSLFEPYKKEIESSESNISCDNIGKGAEQFNLLTHQKVIRDYINLYTPYRGLLLFHGLGSGKTCSSIAIAEGMKNSRRIIVMTPASLRRNYMEELKKCGDFIYKQKQYWEWISLNEHIESLETLSSILNLPLEYIKRKNGAWLVNVTKPSNYLQLSSSEKKSLDDQIDEMIQSKYTFINYNGLRRTRLAELTNNFEKNMFDNSVVIIDEAHNLVSRIVNKLGKEKNIKTDKRGELEKVPKLLALILYEQLLRAKNCRIILLSGTPIINYPNEIAVLFNILRGYIKTWEIPLDVKSKKKVDTQTLREMFLKEKVIDFIDYSPTSSKLFVTRNPFGFKNKIKEKTGYHGVSNEKKNDKGKHVIDEEFVSDETFEKKIIGILKNNDIDIEPVGIKIHNYTALPTNLDTFVNQFINPDTNGVKNINLFKRRIVGLTSYFRSAQEELLPAYEKTPMYHHIIKIPMSDFQFKIYEEAREQERKLEKKSKQKTGIEYDENGLYKQSVSTYRIFSRLFCNFVMTERPVPMAIKPKKDEIDKMEEEGKEKKKFKETINDIIKEASKIVTNNDLDSENEGELEGDEALAKLDITYEERLKTALKYIENHASEYLSPEGLQVHSPKFLQILENITDPQHKGLHLVYSQFRTMEGIGIFSMVLEHNGFTRFKIKRSFAGVWEMDISEEDLGKPTYALYTGTESSEEKEIIRNIYNGNWDVIPTNIANQLREMSNNNNMGEIIKVFMITSSGSEGITLLNTRYVHIMEPYWHPVRIEQVVGRARRICSHKDLPKALQTVEVFIYLMSFTKEQIKSDDAIELRNNDLSKRQPHVPLTSDEALYEIASIKEEINSQLIKAVKESSIDCAIYSKNSKEGLQCLTFGEPNNNKFSYVPNIEKQENEATEKINKKVIEWTGKPVNIQGIKYVARKMSSTLYNIYDFESYEVALVQGGEPRLIGTLEIKPDGKKVFNTLIT